MIDYVPELRLAIEHELQMVVHQLLETEDVERVQEHVRGSLRRICERALDDQVSIESLLVSLRDVWWQLPDSSNLMSDHSADALSLLVRMCIREYYRVEQRPGVGAQRRTTRTRRRA